MKFGDEYPASMTDRELVKALSLALKIRKRNPRTALDILVYIGPEYQRRFG